MSKQHVSTKNRSHLVIMVKLQHTDGRNSTLHLVDLAGSESNSDTSEGTKHVRTSLALLKNTVSNYKRPPPPSQMSKDYIAGSKSDNRCKLRQLFSSHFHGHAAISFLIAVNDFPHERRDTIASLAFGARSTKVFLDHTNGFDRKEYEKDLATAKALLEEAEVAHRTEVARLQNDQFELQRRLDESQKYGENARKWKQLSDEGVGVLLSG